MSFDRTCGSRCGTDQNRGPWHSRTRSRRRSGCRVMPGCGTPTRGASTPASRFRPCSSPRCGRVSGSAGGASSRSASSWSGCSSTRGRSRRRARWTTGRPAPCSVRSSGANEANIRFRPTTASRRGCSPRLNVAGVPFVVWGLVVFDLWLTLFGLALHMGGKNWFIDRMALLYDEMDASARQEVLHQPIDQRRVLQPGEVRDAVEDHERRRRGWRRPSPWSRDWGTSRPRRRRRPAPASSPAEQRRWSGRRGTTLRTAHAHESMSSACDGVADVGDDVGPGPERRRPEERLEHRTGQRRPDPAEPAGHPQQAAVLELLPTPAADAVQFISTARPMRSG